MTNLSSRPLRHSVLSAPVRHRLARITAWHPGTIDVPIDKLLLGGQNTMTARQFAQASGDLLWSSRRVIDGPHADLIQRHRRASLTDSEILATPYGRMARTCLRHTGRYFGAVDPAGIVQEARRFLDRAAGATSPTRVGDHHSIPGVPVLAVPLVGSDCYQVVDGHHRIAIMAARGETTVPVRVRRGTARTALQDLLLRMSWLDGGHELYQPVAAPELEVGWTTVRRCTDRLDLMLGLLVQLAIEPTRAAYLDVASCYGWFVSQMAGVGFAAEGMERDPLGPTVGRVVYGLDPDLIRVGDAVASLRSAGQQWDVVSCFSLLHHFVLGRGSCDAVELVRLLDDVTGRVLFIDTGQAHEAWFRRSLQEWDPTHIREFLWEHTSFDQIIDLGPDQDAVPPYENNYGRHLFACVRSA